MRKFLRNLLLALIPVAVINALCWGTLVFLAWQDDLTYVNYESALDKEKRLEELGNQSRLLIKMCIRDRDWNTFSEVFIAADRGIVVLFSPFCLSSLMY